ncbi:TetR/AcrR family transcriptional regulator [Mycolicibacterium austroafricanum]|nr:TetR/AcrR family transcriptional regulator [Mycolicibacterium austroafricanum]
MRDHGSVSAGQRRSDASANIDRIVAAARQVFAREGASATLSQVAEAAGVSAATLYRHFSNRQALAAAVYEDVFSAEIKPAILALSESSPEAYVDALAQLEEVMSMQRPQMASLDDLANLTTDLILRDRELFENLLMQAQARGDLRTDLTADEVATFVAMVTTASVALNQPKRQRRRYLSLMVDALRPAAAPKRSTGNHGGAEQASEPAQKPR